ncbi:MAG: molybdenum cofactor guanylyltransferase [Deltaproteobacteria bacterium]|nr:molybdenum cofactor guanylyltransferase [Deltaproteobacteria bacterium]
MTDQPYDITGLILAGGASRRMGQPKAQLELSGQKIFERVRSKLAPICQEIILVTNRPTDFLDCDLEIVQDLVLGRGPLGGLATGLLYAHYPWSLALACDLPFVKTEILDYLAQRALAASPGPRALIPEHKAGWEPLVAVYSKSCLKAALKLLSHKRPRLNDLRYNGVFFERVTEEELRKLDQDLISFINLNTPEELEWARDKFAD